ncbi:MAG TPA: hypothetical protein VLR26_11675 [Frankiaceae bacterium]|nr:hypothetical protein [Frankiaceae bacterium]
MADEGNDRGPGRALVAVYAVFVLAAGSRAAVQISTKFSDAPTAYVLSALAAVVYVAATIALASRGPRAHRAAVACCSFELFGVLAVGTYSLLDSSAFPDATVWSDYGMGYLFIPLVLPVLGLLYLHRYGNPRTARGRAGA